MNHPLLLLFLTFLSVSMAPFSFSQETKDIDFKLKGLQETIVEFENEVKSAEGSFAKAVSCATENFNEAIAVLKDDYLKKLVEFQKLSTQENDLDEAIKIRNFTVSIEKKSFDVRDFPKLLLIAENKTAELQKQLDELIESNNRKETKPPLTGKWRWFNGKDTLFQRNGDAIHANNLRGKWQVNASAKSSYIVTWGNGSTDSLVLSEEGRLLQGLSSDKTTVWAVKLR